MNESNLSDEALAELLTLAMEVNEWGTITYINDLGQRHRVLGPAIIWVTGSKGWYQNDNPHRTDGPAYVTSCGYMEWWLDGEHLTEEAWNERVNYL